MDTVLVTGATGFLGSHLVHALLNEKFEVVILKRSTSDIWRIADIINKVESYDVDRHEVDKAFVENEIDIVIHTACNYGRKGESIKSIVETNILFGLEVLECSINHNNITFINTDTFFNNDKLLQKHLNIYTRSKKQFVEWLQLFSDKIQVVNLKLQHIYGPKDSLNKFVPWLTHQLFDQVDEIKLTEGKQKRDFIFIKDVVSAYITIIRNREQLNNFSNFDVGTGNLVSLKRFVECMRNVYQKEAGETNTLLNFGAIPYRENEIMNIEVENQGLKNLGWTPIFSIKEGLQNLIKEFQYKS